MSNKSQSRGVGRRDRAKEQSWRELVARQASSGQSVREFCSVQGLNENSFYAWRQTIRQRDGGAKRTQKAAAFVPAMIRADAGSESWLVIELSGGRALRVPGSIPSERLAELVAAVEGRRP
jgi:transposase-like protein